MGGRVLLGVGRFERAEQDRIAELAREASFEFVIAAGAADVKNRLDEQSPGAMLIDASSDAAQSACLAARSHTEHAHTPMLCVTRDLGDLAFAEAFSWGADDVIDFRYLESLVPRLRPLPSHSGAIPHGERGRAVVADADKNRRIVVARVLSNAGYDVKFALTPQDALSYSVGASLVVFNVALDDGVKALVERAQSGECRWLFTAPPRDVPRYEKQLGGLPRTAVTDGFAPPENIVFLSNEMAKTDVGDQRASARLLYGSMVNFRVAGRDHDDHGYSYNIGAEGLYVRTLAPAPQDDVWLEITPPRTDRLVRLEGRVVWRRPFGLGGHATVPPGFGVKLVAATPTCDQLWQEGYRAFAAQFAKPLSVPSPNPGKG